MFKRIRFSLHFIAAGQGIVDWTAVFAELVRIGFDGPMRPDHVPQMDGEHGETPGYTMLGRLFAYGYMRGLLQATESRIC